MAIMQASLDFLLTNCVTNSREWFQEHKHLYQELVVEPFAQLVTDLAPGMLEIDSQFITEPTIDRTISRIHRDLRIPSNRSRSRYRENCWLLFIRDKKLYNGLPAFYFEVNPAGFSYGMGYYQASSDTMRVLRDMILNENDSFKEALAAYEKQSAFALVGEDYKRPRYPDQPEQLRPWLEKKSLSLICNSSDFDLLFSQQLASTLMEGFRQIAPVYHFLCTVEARRQHP